MIFNKKNANILMTLLATVHILHRPTYFYINFVHTVITI